MVLLAALLLATAGCESRRSPVEETSRDRPEEPEIEPRLSFDDATLEQVNDAGQLVWEVKAKRATYSGDRKIATVENPEAKLYENGEVVFQVRAKRGEVHQNGEKIVLQDSIVAVDARNDLALRGEQLEWFPEQNLLVVRENVSGSHERADLVTDEAQVASDEQRVELVGNVVMNAKDPTLRIASERAVWEMEAQTVTTDKPLQVDRLNEDEEVEDRATANSGQVDLEPQIVTLRQNAQLTLDDPTVQVASNEIVWDLQGQLVSSDMPLNVLHREENTTISGNQGWINLAREIFHVSDGVRVVSEGAEMTSDRLTWYIDTQEFEAEGNVIYAQADPPLRLTGPRAEGQLQEQKFVISGGQVVTEIVPQGAENFSVFPP